MFRIMVFLMVGWLLVACAPGAIDVQVAPVSEVVKQDADLEGLRPVVWAMLSGETDTRLNLVQFVKAACTTNDGLGGPPKCPEGVAEGSELEVLPLGGAEGTYVTRDQIGPALEIPVRALYAIYRVTGEGQAEAYWPEGAYALIFTREVNDYPMPVTVRVSDGKIVRIDHAVGSEPASLIEGVPVENIVLPPEAVSEWVKETFPPKENPAP